MENNKSIKLEETQNSQFAEKLNTTEWYNKVVDSFKFVEQQVSPEFKEQLEKYKKWVLALCSDHMSTTNNPEVQAVIASSNKEFLWTFWIQSEETRIRKHRKLYIDASNNPYYSWADTDVA